MARTVLVYMMEDKRSTSDVQIKYGTIASAEEWFDECSDLTYGFLPDTQGDL